MLEKTEGQSRMDNPDTINTGYTMHRTKVRENLTEIKYGESRHHKNRVRETQDEDKQKRKQKQSNKDE
jgi:hypothetical protein